MLPHRRSDPNLPSTSNQANATVAAATILSDRDHDIYATPYNVEQQFQVATASAASTSRSSHSGHRKKHTHHRRHHHHHQHHHHHRKHGERDNAQNDTLSMIPYANDDDDLFVSSGTIATNLLTSLKQPSKMTFNWSRQFNETLATISGLLQRNFQESPYPGCNVSEASASTATLGSTTAIDSIAKTPSMDKWQKRRRNSLTGDPRELDMLVLEPVNGDDSDGF